MSLILLSHPLPEIIGPLPRQCTRLPNTVTIFLGPKRDASTTKDTLLFRRIIPIPRRTLTNHRFARASLTNRLPMCVQRCQALKKKVIGQHRLFSTLLFPYSCFCPLIPFVFVIKSLFVYGVNKKSTNVLDIQKVLLVDRRCLCESLFSWR